MYIFFGLPETKDHFPQVVFIKLCQIFLSARIITIVSLILLLIHILGTQLNHDHFIQFLVNEGILLKLSLVEINNPT